MNKTLNSFYRFGLSVLCASLAMTPALNATTSFTIVEQRTLIDFEDYEVGTVWSSDSNGTLLNITAPSRPLINTSSAALNAVSTSRQVTFTPQVTVTPAYEVGETLYFSGWFYTHTPSTSGARVRINDRETGGSGAVSMGGFGVIDASGHSFATWRMVDGTSTWLQSSTQAAVSTWYEVALVIQLNAEDISKSLSYYFIRNVTAGETEFTMLEDLSGIEMDWYTDDLNPTDFQYWRIEGFRSGAQIDNLASGIATMAIPEPTTVMSCVGGLLLAGVLLCRRLKSETR